MNVDQDRQLISKLMTEFEKHIQSKGISEIEKQIWKNNLEIDEIVYSLYQLSEDERDMIRTMYHCDTVSEYFDRLEEYVGIEDINF